MTQKEVQIQKALGLGSWFSVTRLTGVFFKFKGEPLRSVGVFTITENLAIQEVSKMYNIPISKLKATRVNV